MTGTGVLRFRSFLKIIYFCRCSVLASVRMLSIFCVFEGLTFLGTHVIMDEESTFAQIAMQVFNVDILEEASHEQVLCD